MGTEEPPSDLGQTNKSGPIASLAEVGGRGKKGPAAITATQLGVDKSNVTRELQRRKNENQRKTEVLARVPPEQHEKLFLWRLKMIAVRVAQQLSNVLRKL